MQKYFTELWLSSKASDYLDRIDSSL